MKDKTPVSYCPALFQHICFMRKLFIVSVLAGLVLLLDSFSKESLRAVYAKPPAEWPRPYIDSGVQWTELGLLPESPLQQQKDSLKDLIELGKALFFDTRLSGSGKISCSTCHQPELNWTDGKERSEGHEGTIVARNAPTIQNAWFYKKLFWDGRARDLQDQAFAPIVSESEMHSEMQEVISKLRKINGYREMFRKAYGTADIDPDRMTEAIATFEKTITSNKSRFDEFLAGNKKALTGSELRGLHLFRTKARCINCHNGPLFTDNQFHKTGLASGDVGLYKVTHKEEDTGKFKTPSLRDVMRTGPWLHDGSMKSIPVIIDLYKKGPAGADRLIRPLMLSGKERKDLQAFLEALSSAPLPFNKPVLPQ
ncbi:MAG: cytochrome c peroxidase [Chitinophagaceae bacterium]